MKAVHEVELFVIGLEFASGRVRYGSKDRPSHRPREAAQPARQPETEGPRPSATAGMAAMALVPGDRRNDPFVLPADRRDELHRAELHAVRERRDGGQGQDRHDRLERGRFRHADGRDGLHDPDPRGPPGYEPLRTPPAAQRPDHRGEPSGRPAAEASWAWADSPAPGRSCGTKSGPKRISATSPATRAPSRRSTRSSISSSTLNGTGGSAPGALGASSWSGRRVPARR